MCWMCCSVSMDMVLVAVSVKCELTRPVSDDAGDDDAYPAPPTSALVAEWKAWLDRADFVVLSVHTDHVPWTPDLLEWFNSNFDVVGAIGQGIYRHRR